MSVDVGGGLLTLTPPFLLSSAPEGSAALCAANTENIFTPTR